MTKYVNKSGGFLVLPDQRQIANGQEVEVTSDGEKNIAVGQWIDEGKLVKANATKSDAKSDK